jgi:PAP2 superfamily/RTX calcium-binding nonapeptide repeat (4 copies)
MIGIMKSGSSFRIVQSGRGRPGNKASNGPCFEKLDAREMLHGNPVVSWNEILLDAIRSQTPPPPAAARAMAILHVAIFDAVNSITNRYVPYASFAPAHSMASLEAAVAAAAEHTLSSLFPALQSTFAAELAHSLSEVPDGIREDQGVAVGRAVASVILHRRSNDGSSNAIMYTPGTDPGEWRPTSPAFAPALLPHWGNVSPWVMSSGSQFRAIAPPTLDSAEYAAAVNEVKSLGSAASTTRTADQSNIARIWAGGPGTATPPGQWNMIARELAESQNLDLPSSARLFARLNVALADAAISCWDTKYEFNLWRPITAIQNADADGNAATDKDPSFTSLLPTPPFPAYTSGHSTFSGAASAVLASTFGTDNLTFVLRSEVGGVADRTYNSLRAAAEEAGISRIYGGIHFSFDNTQALAAGRQIGALAATRFGNQSNVMARQDGNRLFVAGTAAADNLAINREGSQLVVRNHGRVVERFNAASVDHVFINGFRGNDNFAVSHALAVSSEMIGEAGDDTLFGAAHRNWLYGGPGDDKIHGGLADDVLNGGAGNDWLFGYAGSDVIDGGAGNDFLYGHAGRDILVGGSGIDWLFAGLDDDVLIGGLWGYENNESARSALRAEWNSGRGYSERVSNLSAGTGPVLSGTSFLLQKGTTVTNDSSVDYLYGESGRDLFFADSGDFSYDRWLDEVLF